MEIKIIEEYPGEWAEKEEKLKKALFPNTKAMTSLKVPERDFRDKVMRELLDDLELKYKNSLEEMWDAIELKVADWYGR